MQSAQPQLQKGWNQSQCETWRKHVLEQGALRNYEDIISRVTRLPANTHTFENYGTTAQGHSLLRVTVGDINNGRPNILITGGVHGYEPSGVEAALKFLEDDAPSLTDTFNFVVYPCLSPWAYEYDQRWNPQAEDPNRLFARNLGNAKPHVHREMDIDECRHFMNSMETSGIVFSCAIDLHETSNRDIDLRILRAERFDETLANDYKEIPQGYYLTLSKRESESENDLQRRFGKSIIDRVQEPSPIAPEPTILSGKTNEGGIILSPPSNGLLRTYLDGHAKIVAVTEVNPDAPGMIWEKTVQAQLASIHGAMDYVRELAA